MIHGDFIDFGLDFNIGGHTLASNKNNRSKQVHTSDEMNAEWMMQRSIKLLCCFETTYSYYFLLVILSRRMRLDDVDDTN